MSERVCSCVTGEGGQAECADRAGNDRGRQGECRL